MAEFQKEGSVFFRLDHPDADWRLNQRSYEWGPFGASKGVTVSVLKTPERTLSVTVQFESFMQTFTGPLPQPDPIDVSLGLTWKAGEETMLFVNGHPTRRARFGPGSLSFALPWHSPVVQQGA
jgi:hypothetical protein